MSILILIFGAFTGTFLCALVGLLGRGRNIGFGWAFIISLFFTPLIGLIATLISEKTDSSSQDNLGCLGILATVIGAAILLMILGLLLVL